MGRGKNLDSLRLLDDDILHEVIREGEVMLAAQFAAATASDQRATAWAGFVITLAVAATGATATIALSGKNLALAVITGLLSVLLSVAAFIAIQVFRPQRFALPGNRPENWLPGEWESGKARNIQQARIEQARCLNNQIDDNAGWAEQAATRLRLSMDLTAISSMLAAVYVGGFVLFRYFG